MDIAEVANVSHTRVHRPQRMQVSPPAAKRGASTPCLVASSRRYGTSGQRASSNSSTIRRCSTTSSVAVRICIPSSTGKLQAVTSFVRPLWVTSTRHRRQAP
jgi:hypothetical protein